MSCKLVILGLILFLARKTCFYAHMKKTELPRLAIVHNLEKPPVPLRVLQGTLYCG